MKKLGLAAVATALTAVSVNAGGIDRSRAPYSVIFEDGNYVQVSFSSVSPDVSGTFVPALGGISTGDMADDYNTFSLAFKTQLTDKLSAAFMLNEPFGANATYRVGVYDGLRAEWETQQLTFMLRYEFTDRISAFGGLRYLRSTADIDIPDALFRASPAFAAAPPGTLNYSARGERSSDWGYVLGVAYEIPDIALRVALTYENAVDQEFSTSESWPAVTMAPGFVPTGVTEVTLPQIITLDFQSGIAKDTLLFGSIRWTEWTEWAVAPPVYGATIGDNVVDFENDTITYELGVGRKLSDKWSVFARASYEKSNGGISSRLAPTDGKRAFGIGGTYTHDNIKVTGGIEYVNVGNAVDGSGTQFRNNDAIGVGVSVGFSF